MQAPLLSVSQALDTLLTAARKKQLTSQNVQITSTLHANKRVLASDIGAPINVPSAPNSQMDGYAINVADIEDNEQLFEVSQRIPAGHCGAPLQAKTVARIFTGAVMPQGANAVVMQEQCEVVGGKIKLLHQPKVGEWVRQTGEDIRQGDVILKAGTLLRAQECGLAASIGLAELPVARRLKVAIFFTGDELVMPGNPLPQGAIYNSNRYLISSLLNNLGCVVTDFGIVPDNLEQTRATLRQAALDNDVIITSGGVSVGEEDHVKPAVTAEGQLHLWQIAMKPGKPLAFGAVKDAFFIGLPGNPVSSVVTCLILVRPFLLALQGVNQVAPKPLKVRADFDWARPDKRQEFLRAQFNEQGGLSLFAHQGSAVLSSTVWADGLIDNPAGCAIKAGDWVSFIPFSALL